MSEVKVHTILSTEYVGADGYSVSKRKYVEYDDYANLAKRLEEADGLLRNLGEYWNRDNNGGAMEDACWHVVNSIADYFTTPTGGSDE